jgi:hypothetical protein
MRLSRFGRAVFCFPTKETALLHANFAMDSIPHSLQAFLLIAGGMIGLLAAFSLVDSYAAESRASHEARASAENRVDSGSHAPVELSSPLNYRRERPKARATERGILQYFERCRPTISGASR